MKKPLHLVLLLGITLVFVTSAYCQYIPQQNYLKTDKGIVPMKPDYVNSAHYTKLSSNLFRLEEYNWYGLVDFSGNTIAPLIYRAMGCMSADGMIAALDTNKKWGFLDSTGKVILPFIYEAVGEFNEGSVWVNLHDKNMYIDRKGQKVCDCNFELCDEFSEGLAIVFIGAKRGYINRQGELVIPLIFNDAERFKDGRAKVLIKREYYLINKKGRRKKDLGPKIERFIQPL
jgi:WG containing repeat